MSTGNRFFSEIGRNLSLIRCRASGTSHMVARSSRLGLNWERVSKANRISVRCFAPSATRNVRIVYVEADGTEREAEAKVGQNLMEVAHENNIDLEGACGGELACSTCHLIFDQETFDSLPPMTEEEQDMLDLAFEVTDTSRLGCQITVRPAFEGIKVRIPDDGFS